MSKNGPAGSTKGFSLIELLVVIAIIAILAAILFPLLLASKSASKRSSDLQSQRQIGMGLCMYADDYDGSFPWVSKAGTLSYFPSYPVSNVNTTISGELIMLLKQYVKSKPLFYCPAVEVYNKNYGYAVQKAANPPFMYIGFYYYCGEGWIGKQPIKQSGDPRRILLSCIGGGVGTGSGGYQEGMSGHGKARGIFTFADGHAKYIRHFNYPYSYNECVALGDMKKLLMPKWPDR